MPNRHEIRGISDSRRDAERYHRLLLALDRATGEIRCMESESHPNIDEVLNRLLPDLVTALNAEQAFVAVLREDKGGGEKWFELTSVYPRANLSGHRIEWSDLLQQLVKDGEPKVIEPLGEESRDPIPGLAILDATSAVLVRMQTADQVRVVGICNKADPNRGPYLAADGMALDSIVELVAIGARVGERRRRELQGIQETSAAISAELDLDELLPMIAKSASEVFGAPATSLMLWDEAEENLVIMASEGLSNKYVQQQRVPGESVYAAVESIGGFQPLLTPDLHLEPFGDIDLIKSERLCTVLSAPLLVSDQLIGILNIYSRDQPRQFTSYEIELSQIFANQVAVAIQNARLFEKEQHRTAELTALSAVSATINSSLNLREVLRTITDSIIQVTGCQKSAIFLVDQNSNELNLEMARGLSKEYVLGSKSLKIGPKTRAAVIFDRTPIAVTDIEVHPKFALYKELARQEGFRAFIDVPMKIKEEIIGAISAYYGEPHDFLKEEIDILTTFANQAAIAVHNARQYEALRQAQMDLASVTTVAWLGIPGAVWSHDVNQKTSAICYNTDTLRNLIHPQDEISQEILGDIERAAREIQDIPLKGPLPAQTGEPVKPIVVDKALDKWVPRWCKGRSDVKVNLQLRCGNTSTRIDDQWLAVALQTLVGNALKAMPDGGDLTVASKIVNDVVNIRLEDTGCGIPEKALPYFLKEYVPPTVRRDRSGSGMGALMAKFILHSYGGDLKLLWTEEGKGTALSILLPVA